MASLSLPRVLQLKKNSVDAEREHFEKFQTLAIQKAINAAETPVKEKHVRSTIIGTFQEQSAITYWMVAIRLPLQDNRIVAWKFCHVTHKLLREGHPACLDDSQRHISMIENLGKLWVHLREGYGKLVNLYCALLICKLRFHARNPRFPGNMHLTSDELDAIAENDVNNYFQLCVELFDYMDDILNLQAAVFDSLGNARANSMTASGQCRLAALIPCAQDSSQIYDCNVRLLFRLHAALPPDTLQGHRERFRQQFKKLSSFYKHASSLQYYRNLLSLPVLPANPPNFLVQSDFGTYVTPVVSIPEPAADEPDAVGSLIDTSDTMSQVTSPELDAFDARTPSPPQPDPLLERDRLIDHLQNELKRTRQEISHMVQERNTMVASMREHCTRLEAQLQTAKTELVKEKEKAEVLSAETPEIKQKLSEVEDKARITDEKFQKLKGAYTQLREEHINLIRQKAEVDKMSANLRAAAAQHESAKMALQQQLHDKMKDVELLQQSASSTEEVDAYKSELANLRSELESSRQKELELETLKASMEALQIEHKTASTESEEKINIINNELVEVRTNLEIVRKEKETREYELAKVKEELAGLREKSGDEYKKAVEEKDEAVKSLAELTEQFQQQKQEHVNRANNLEDELNKLNIKLTDVDTHFMKEHEKWRTDMVDQNNRFESILLDKDTEIKEALQKLTILQETINTLMEDKDKGVKHYELEKNNLLSKLKEEENKNLELLKDIAEKETNMELLNEKLNDISAREDESSTSYNELLKKSSFEIGQLKETLVSNDLKIADLESLLRKEIETGTEIKSKLEATLQLNKQEIEELNQTITKANSTLNIQKSDFLTKIEQYEKQIIDLKEELKEAGSSSTNKEDTIHSLETLLAARNNEILCMRTEIKTLRSEIEKLTEDLHEREAELEIGQNELLHLKEDHQAFVTSNDNNLAMKNQELRILNEEINELKKERSELIQEKENKAIGFALEKQVLETRISSLETECNSLRNEFKNTQTRKDEMVNKLNEEIKKLSSFYDDLKEAKEKEIQILNATLDEQTVSFSKKANERDSLIRQASSSVEELKKQLDDLKEIKENEISELERLVSDKESEKQMLDGRLRHVETEKLTAECELQDLLQHNHSLEDSLTELKRQLMDAQQELEKNRQSIVTCAGAAAIEVTSSALAALDRGSSQDSGQAAAQLAAQAFRDLAAGDVKGKEESVAKSAVLAAHGAAQLAAYVTEVSNGSTDLELSDKLTTQCRGMLQSAKQCMESLQSGNTDLALDVSSRVNAVLVSVSAADKAHSATRSVDDELADMDTAIEQAAGQIEEMLRASRAGDSGVQLEVNEKILDACTTLMAAVKILVQDARRLQNELGDPTSRMKMYRRNPQWSQGLISAAKAVVFAAKLLVTSADEAVSATGRAEGVSAAAHEVAGSTAQLVAASRARAPPAAPALARLTQASRSVAAATGAVVAAVRAGSALVNEQEALDTSALSLTATRRLEMESKVRALQLESALDAERARLAALRRRHYQLAQTEENNGITNGK